MKFKGRRRRYARYQRQRSFGPKANWKGVYSNHAANPDTLYTQVYQRFTSGELFSSATSPGNLFCNSGRRWQNGTSGSELDACRPHALCMNDPKLCMQWPGPAPTTYFSATNWIDLDKWATFYEYCTHYETNVILRIGTLFSLDAGWTGYLNGEDSWYLYYALPNVEVPPTGAAAQACPWNINSTSTPASTVMKTPKIRRIKLTTANMVGRDVSTTLRIRWKLRDVGDPSPDYMNKSVSAVDLGGTSFGAPVNRSGFSNFDAARHWLYFWIGTDNTPSNYNVQCRWECSIYSKVKLFQPRQTALAPFLKFVDGIEEKRLEEEPEQEDAMLEDVPYESLPSTPLMEQLTRELQVLGNVPKKIQKKI